MRQRGGSGQGKGSRQRGARPGQGHGGWGRTLPDGWVRASGHFDRRGARSGYRDTLQGGGHEEATQDRGRGEGAGRVRGGHGDQF